MSDRAMYRYVIPVDDQPHGEVLTGEPVAVATTADGRAVEFWAEHDPELSKTAWTFQVFGTGQPIPDGADWVGTCPRTDLGLVWHLYEVG
jgi:hypothetical protein